MTPTSSPGRDRAFAVALGLVVIVAACITALASLRNSVTWDEPLMISAGARGFATGDYTMAWDQPPGMLYVYGGAVHLYGALSELTGGKGLTLPSEQGTIVLPPEIAAQLPARIRATGPVPRWGLYSRYDYARELFFKSGNDPEAVAFAARLATTIIAAVLALMVGVFAWRRAGPLAALLATTLFAFLPDELAHGAIAYNDVALSLCFFVALWAIDRFIREPAEPTAAIVGITVGLALSVKFSALALGPAAVLLCAAEALARGRDGQWVKRLALFLPIAIVATLVVLLVVYRGDVSLAQFREGVGEQLRHSGAGHGVPAYLFGHTSEDGFWYFFPVALILKTPVAFHILGIIALAGYASVWQWRRDLFGNSLRFLAIGIVVYLAILMQSKLDIGVRYALPVLPLLTLLIGIGLARLWERKPRSLRVTIGLLVLASVGSTVSHYPWFLSYITEYIPPERSHTAMVDSNLDWGQGLLALRDFIRDEHIPGVYLGYFGSALPEGYGIRYVGLPSWSPLPPQPPPPAPFEWVVISETLLQGLYESGDPFRPLRDRKPDRIIGNSLFAYHRP